MKGAVGLSLVLVGLALIMLVAGAVVVLSESDGGTVELNHPLKYGEPGSGGGAQPSGPEVRATDQGAPDAEPDVSAANSATGAGSDSISVTGRFLTGSGNPLPGVAVTATPPLDPSPVLSGADGTFSALLPIDWSGEAVSVFFTASRGGFMKVYRQTPAKSGGTIDLGNVVMPPAAAGQNPGDPRAAGAGGRRPGRDPSARLPDRRRPDGERLPRRPDERKRRDPPRPDGDTVPRNP